MSIESVLVYLHPHHNTAAVLDVAIDVARKHGAQLAGLHVVQDIPDVGRPAVSDQAESLEQIFRKRAQDVQLSHAWYRMKGHAETLVARESRCHDILVIGQDEPSRHPAWPMDYEFLENILIKSGRALIAVPYLAANPSVGNQIVIAWNGAREVARAIEDAMPILEKARHAIVLTVDVRRGDALSVDHLMQLLERHGVNAEARGVRSHGKAIGEVLLSEAQELRCDLLVMGGYGHLPTREHLFGGPTYAVVKHMTMPVLLSH